jgi:hypothetical protein
MSVRMIQGRLRQLPEDVSSTTSLETAREVSESKQYKELRNGMVGADYSYENSLHGSQLAQSQPDRLYWE